MADPWHKAYTRNGATMADATPTPPEGGAKITIKNGKLQVPDKPIVPFIEGDGTGPDVWRATVRILDAAIEKAYGGERKIHWMEIFAGQKANDLYNSWLPDLVKLHPQNCPRTQYRIALDPAPSFSA